MAAEAPTTIHDLPDDMLHEIFGRLFHKPTPPGHDHDVTFLPTVDVSEPPKGTHLVLRSVCRRWRAVADFARLQSATCRVPVASLANAATARPRHPAAVRSLVVGGPSAMYVYGNDLGHAVVAASETVGLIKNSATLRRSLNTLDISMCCPPSLVRAMPTVLACPALTSLTLSWGQHDRQRAMPADQLKPLSALKRLNHLSLIAATSHTAWPVLPEAQRLTALELHSAYTHVPVGSDAALARLRWLGLVVWPPLAALQAEDPFGLRAALDAGAWQPSRLTGLKELSTTIYDDGPPDVPQRRRRSPVGAEWAPLARHVSDFKVETHVGSPMRPSTGIVGGFGALTGLLEITALLAPGKRFHPGTFPPVAVERLRTPRLAQLIVDCATSPMNVAAFPNLTRIAAGAVLVRQPPLMVRTLAARPRLALLTISCDSGAPPTINLADLIASGLPALEMLHIENAVLEWDEAGMAGVPTAAWFAATARRWLPRMIDVKIEEARGHNALPDRSRVAFVLACRRHVVPALLGLNRVRH